MEHNIKTPVLLIAFNRPNTTQIVFNSIRKEKPKKLYIAIDGPRSHKLGESEMCKQVIEITKQVDWDCETHYLIRDTNLGCKLGVTSAISWALENENSVIIIEDDIIATTAFFNFAENLLEKYQDNEQIAMISANNYTPINSANGDYFFSKYGHIWGWATWKRVWEQFDVNLPYLKNDIDNKLLSKIGLPKEEQQHFKKYAKYLLNAINDNSINTWDFQFAYFRVRNKMLSIVPRVNLASNIGTTSSRTDNVTNTNENYYPSDNNFVLLKHPVKVACDYKYDKHHFQNHINHKTLFIKRAFHKVSRVLKFR